MGRMDRRYLLLSAAASRRAHASTRDRRGALSSGVQVVVFRPQIGAGRLLAVGGDVDQTLAAV